MAVTYYVALPFVRTEEGVAPGEGKEMPNERAAIRQAETMSRDPANAGALPPSATDLAAGRIVIPALAPALVEQAERYLQP